MLLSLTRHRTHAWTRSGRAGFCPPSLVYKRSFCSAHACARCREISNALPKLINFVDETSLDRSSGPKFSTRKLLSWHPADTNGQIEQSTISATKKSMHSNDGISSYTFSNAQHNTIDASRQKSFCWILHKRYYFEELYSVVCIHAWLAKNWWGAVF